MTVRRRTFLGAAASAILIPGGASAQPVRLVGALIGAGDPATDPSARAWTEAIRAGLSERGWHEGLSVHVEPRFNAGRRDLSATFAAELAAMLPDIFVCGTNQNAVNCHRAAPDVPLVFAAVTDPIGAGLVQSIARPGGNVTGVSHYEPTVGGKFVELLLQVFPDLQRVGFMYNPASGSTSWEYFLPHFLQAAATYGVEPLDIAVRSVEEVAPAIDALASAPLSGLVISTNNWSQSNRTVFLEAVNRNRLPTIRGFPNADGGLLSYAVDTTEAFRLAGGYAGRILDGDSPANLPVLSAPRYLLTVNLRTAAAQGLLIPPTLLAIADRIVE